MKRVEKTLFAVIGVAAVVGILAFVFNFSIDQSQLGVIIMFIMGGCIMLGVVFLTGRRQDSGEMKTAEVLETIRNFWLELRHEELTTSRMKIRPWYPPGSQTGFFLVQALRKKSWEPINFYFNMKTKNILFNEHPETTEFADILEGFASSFEKEYGGVVPRRLMHSEDDARRYQSGTTVYVNPNPKDDELQKVKKPRD